MMPERGSVWQRDQKDLRRIDPRKAGPEYLWCEELMCHVASVTYDFAAKTGRVDTPPFNCPRGMGVIELFKKIDPAVKRVYAVSETPEYSYHWLLGDDWEWRIQKTLKDV